MGNRAVIVSRDTNAKNRKNKIGVYLHWYGSESTVKEFLRIAKEKGIRDVESDESYFWARFTQIIAGVISEKGDNVCSIGVNVVERLDCHNYDNGVYYIDGNFEIVKHTDGSELEVDDE